MCSDGREIDNLPVIYFFKNRSPIPGNINAPTIIKYQIRQTENNCLKNAYFVCLKYILCKKYCQ